MQAQLLLLIAALLGAAQANLGFSPLLGVAVNGNQSNYFNLSSQSAATLLGEVPFLSSTISYAYDSAQQVAYQLLDSAVLLTVDPLSGNVLQKLALANTDSKSLGNLLWQAPQKELWLVGGGHQSSDRDATIIYSVNLDNGTLSELAQFQPTIDPRTTLGCWPTNPFASAATYIEADSSDHVVVAMTCEGEALSYGVLVDFNVAQNSYRPWAVIGASTWPGLYDLHMFSNASGVDQYAPSLLAQIVGVETRVSLVQITLMELMPNNPSIFPNAIIMPLAIDFPFPHWQGNTAMDSTYYYRLSPPSGWGLSSPVMQQFFQINSPFIDDLQVSVTGLNATAIPFLTLA